MDKIVRASVVAGALMAGGGVFYHFVIFLPGVEKAKAEKLEAEERAAERKAATRQVFYDACKTSARRAYDAEWAEACRSNASNRQREYQHCLRDPAVIGNQFLGKPHCEKTYGFQDASSECNLPSGRANALNSRFKESEEKCLVEAKSGLLN